MFWNPAWRNRIARHRPLMPAPMITTLAERAEALLLTLNPP
jgi:hypothetical protein